MRNIQGAHHEESGPARGLNRDLTERKNGGALALTAPSCPDPSRQIESLGDGPNHKSSNGGPGKQRQRHDCPEAGAQ